MMALEWSQHYQSIFKMLKDSNSIKGDGTLTEFKLIQAFMVVLICKNEYDLL